MQTMEGLIELKEKLKIYNLKYDGQFIIRPKKYHPERLYQLMQQSGCRQLYVGIESGSEAVRNHMKKKFSNEDIDYHLAMCSKYKIENFIYMFAGYPTETLQDHQDTKDFYIKNQKYILDDTISGTSLTSPMGIHKNTPIDLMRDELQIEMHGEYQYSNLANWTVGTNPTLTIKERFNRYIELAKLTTKLQYRRSYIDLYFLEQNINDIKKIIKQ
jgi:radical SAM superfamily enzyme YgiQ (UPF0313 family)